MALQPPLEPQGRVEARSSGSGAPASTENSELLVQSYLNILYKNRWVVLGAFVVSVLAAALYTMRQPPVYEARSVLFVGKQQASPQLKELLMPDFTNRDVMNEVEILRSFTMASNVAQQLITMGRVPGTQRPFTALLDPDGRQPTVQDVAERLGSYVEISPKSREVDMVDVVVSSSDPQEAAVIANLYTEEYIAYNLRDERARFSKAREYLSDVTEQVDSTLQSSETNVVDFQNQQGVLNPELEAQQLVEQLSALEQRRGELAAQAAGARAEIAGYDQQMRRIAPGVANRIERAEDQVLPRLQQERGALVAQLETLYERYPEERTTATPDQRIVRLRDQITALDRQIGERTRSFVAQQLEEPLAAGGAGGPNAGGLGALQEAARLAMQRRAEAEQYTAAGQIVASQIAEVRARLAQLPAQSAFLGRLNLNIQTQADIYQQALGQLQEAKIAEQSEIGSANIVDSAVVPREPVGPRKTFNLIFAALLGLVGGAGFAFVRETVDTRLRRPDDLRKRGYTVIGVIPDMMRAIRKDFDGRSRVTIDGRSYDTRLATLLTPMSPVAESYRRLRTSIQFSRPDAPPQVISVTSPGPGEGKSVTSMNIAVAMAQAGYRTVCIDADLRRPTSHKLLGLPREPGLVDILFNELTDLEQFRTEADDLYVIPAGRSVPNPSELIGSRKMQALLEQFRTEFDFVIVDTPPVLAVTDAVVLATRVDAVVLVASANATTWHAALRSAEQLDAVKADLLGFVLNRFDSEVAYGGYGYGYTYGYGYSDYYGSGPGETTSQTPA